MKVKLFYIKLFAFIPRALARGFPAHDSDEIKLSDYDNKEHECYCDLVKNSCCVNDLKSFANYEASLDTPIKELSEFLREGDYND